MRFHVTAALFAAASLFNGAVAAEQTTSLATLTLTRTVQRVVQTVTATRQTASASVLPSGAYGAGYTNGTTITTASLTSTSQPAKQSTGAAVPLNAEMLGMAAIAGLAGFMAL